LKEQSIYNEFRVWKLYMNYSWTWI